MLKKHIVIFTDGSCLGNPGPGGWAALLRYEAHEKMISGHVEYTTNNRMELQAVIESLSCLKAGYVAEIHTDSQYVKRGVEEWMPNWKKRAWKTAAGKPVQNQDLWEQLDALLAQQKAVWYWVKGHGDSVENNLVDEEARAQAEKAKREK